MLLCVTLSLTPQKEDNALYTYVARDVSALFICRQRGLRAFLTCSEKNRSARFVRKKFARKKPLSGKFEVFGPLERTHVHFLLCPNAQLCASIAMMTDGDGDI